MGGGGGLTSAMTIAFSSLLILVGFLSAQPGPSNPVMQQAYPMTSPNNAHTLRMHTGYDQ